MPWQRAWQIEKKRSARSIICTQSAFTRWKECENWSSIYIPRHSTGYANFAMSYQKFTNEACQLWSYWTKVHDVKAWPLLLTRRAYIDVAIFYSVSECHRDKGGRYAILPQNWLPWQRPLRYRKQRSGPDRSSAAKTLSDGERTAEIGPIDPEIIVLRAKK